MEPNASAAPPHAAHGVGELFQVGGPFGSELY